MTSCLIFMDIDGTLVDENMSISSTDKATISQVIEQGSVVYLATGRKYAAAKQVAERLHPDVQVVASNGCVYECQEQFFKESFAQNALKMLFALCRSKDVSLFFFGKSETFYTKNLPDYFKSENQARLTTEKEQQFIKISTINELAQYQEQIVNGIIISEEDFEILEEIKTELKSSELVNVSSSHVNNIELTPRGISKATAIQAIQQEYKISRGATYAFGDGLNDIEMFAQAEFSVAMGNAPEEVKKSANYQTLSNLESGISHFLKKAMNLPE